MSWTKLNKQINPHSVMNLNSQSCRDYGVTLDNAFPFHKVKFTCQALAMLSQINHFDQQMVAKDIKQICAHPNAKNSIKHSRNPFKRLWRTKYPFRNYHYLIEYTNKDNQIHIEDILFDEQLHGPNKENNFSAERTMLYQVDRLTSASYNKAMDKEGLREVAAAWSDQPEPTTKINTAHAAVNGMLNDLTKATWLMGTHLDTAYQADGIKAYTLFHNPTDSGTLDVVECLFDKRSGTKSHNAQHLAAVLAQNQQHGKSVKWLVHSQGAIVFCAALETYRIKHSGRPLTGQQLAVHGSGANIDRLKRIANHTGIKIIAIRNNPYDLVANLAGARDFSTSSLARSLKFSRLVCGDNNDIGASPHTLPFLGLKTYADQLQLSGEVTKATTVRKFINTLNKERDSINSKLHG